MAMDLPPNEAFSGIFGSISLTSWIFLIVPQLWENFQNQSAEGLSPLFLITWLAGDICNLIGAIWANLLPTVIGIGIYFVFIDGIMLLQLVYYNYYRSRRLRTHGSAMASTDESGEASVGPSATDPLLPQNTEGSDREPEQPTRRKSSAASSSRRRRDSLTMAFSDRDTTHEIVRNTLSVFFVLAVGTLGWFTAWKTGTWNPAGDDLDSDAPVGALVLGYASSFFYLTARIPQIYTNMKRQSCDGLSVLFFILSTIGNLTYGASILSYSVERNYLQKNTPWLLGSIGTLVQDFVIFGQFRYYASLKRGQVRDAAM